MGYLVIFRSSNHKEVIDHWLTHFEAQFFCFIDLKAMFFVLKKILLFFMVV